MFEFLIVDCLGIMFGLSLICIIIGNKNPDVISTWFEKGFQQTLTRGEILFIHICLGSISFFILFFKLGNIGKVIAIVISAVVIPLSLAFNNKKRARVEQEPCIPRITGDNVIATDKEAIEAYLQTAAEKGKAVTVLYYGGSQPGTKRQLIPTTVVNHWRIHARDLASDMEKTFLIERMQIVTEDYPAPEYIAEPENTGKAENNLRSYFKIQGTGRDTGRKRKHVYTAWNEEHARALADADGTIVDSITQIPHDPPTERQLAYARHLRIKIPEDAIKEEVTDLISVHEDKDEPSSEIERSYAKKHEARFTRFTGKKWIYNNIFYALCREGKEQDLVSWFAYHVCIDIVGRKKENPIDNPDHPTIREIASVLSADPSVIKSICRYSGEDIIRFGEWTDREGRTHTGGSRKTIAYKTIAEALKERLNKVYA